MKIKTITLTYTVKSEYETKVNEVSKSSLFKFAYPSPPNRMTFKVLDPDNDIDYLTIQYIDIVELHFSKNPLI